MELSTNKGKIHKKTGSSCIVCDEQIEENHIVLHKTRRQSHKMCLTCGEGYLAPIFHLITENLRKNIRTTTIRCPGSYHSAGRNQCTTRVDITRLVIPDSADIYTSLVRIQFVLSNYNVFVCPNSECGNIVEVNPTDLPRTECHSCNTIWCRNCHNSPYHDKMSCIEYEACQNQTENGKYIWEMKTQGLLNFCPQCRVPTLKRDGCNKIVCITCGGKWCWLCKDIGIDYGHFNSLGVNPCANRLWEGVNIDI
jgi:hypothetical protein